MGYRPLPAALRPLLTRFEGYKPKTYLDSKGVPTAGIGHTGKDVVVGKTYTASQIEAWFASDMMTAVATIYRFVPSEIVDALPEDCYTALISFTYNVGSQAYINPETKKDTNFRKALVQNRLNDVDDRMLDWDKSTVGGKLVRIPGLMQRRATEAAIWNSGLEKAAAPKVPVGVSQLVNAALITPPEPETPEPDTEAPEVDMSAQDVGAADDTALSDIPVHVPHIGEGVDSTVQPSAPADPGIDRKSITAVVSTGIGAVAAAGPDVFTSSGQQLTAYAAYLPALGTIGGVLIAVGIGIVIWRAIETKREKAS